MSLRRVGNLNVNLFVCGAEEGLDRLYSQIPTDTDTPTAKIGTSNIMD